MTLKKNTLILYKKLLYFSFFYYNICSFNYTYLVHFRIIKILKIIFYINSFKVFISNNFNIYNSIFLSFWKNGYITNFRVMRWLFIKKLHLKKLPNIILNLTNNINIDLELKNSNLPLININKHKNNIYYDFLFKSDVSIENDLNNNLDNVFFFMLFFKSVKKYKNV